MRPPRRRARSAFTLLAPNSRAREGRTEPATLVSRATRNRTDPLAPPAGRRRHFLNSGWGLVRPPRRRIAGVVGGAGRAQRGTGSTSNHPDRNSTELGGGVDLNGAYFPRARARAEPSDALRQQTDPLEPAGRRFANFFFESSFSTVLFRDFPSDVGQQSDPQSDRPAGAACWPPSPLLEFGLGAGAAAAAPDSLVWSAAPGERSEVRGRLRYHPDRNSTELGGGVDLNGAYFPRARARAEPSDALRQQTDPLEPAGRRFANFFFESSFSTVLFRDFPSDVGQQSDPQSDRPAGAACWPPSPLLEFGLGAGAAAAAPDLLVWSAAPGERSEVRGRLRYHPDRNSTELGGGVDLNGAYFPRARARAEPSDALRQQTDPLEPAGRRFANFFFESSFSTVLFRDFPSDVGQQSDPQSDRPAGAACWPPSPLLEFGLGAGAAAAAPDLLVWSAAPGERSEVRGRLRYHPDRNSTELGGGVDLNGAYFPRARARAEPSDALRQQTDPLEPAGRRFANFFFESSFSTVLFRDFPSDVGQQSDPQSDRPAGAACWPPSPLLEFGLGAGAAAAAPDLLVWSAAPGERSEVRGRLRYHPDRNSTELGGGVDLNGAYFPRARARAEPSDALRQQTDPLEPAGRRFANFFFESSFSTVLFRDFPSDVGQQSDPQSDRPAGAACWPPSPLLEFGLGAGAAAAAPDSLVWSAAPGERSEVRGRLRYHPDRNSTELGSRRARAA